MRLQEFIIYAQTITLKLFTVYNDLPQVIAFELRDKSTLLDSTIWVKQLTGTQLTYRLAGVVYFGDMHFVTRIVRQDGQIWFHDGITTQRNLIYEGRIASGHIDLTSVRSKGAHTGIYCRISDPLVSSHG